MIKINFHRLNPSALIFILMSLLLSSCTMTFEKRRYRPGYHIDMITKRNEHRMPQIFQKENMSAENISLNPQVIPIVKDSINQNSLVLVSFESNTLYKESTSKKLINYKSSAHVKYKLKKPVRKLSNIFEVKKTNDLRGKKIAAWVLGILGIIAALCSIFALTAGSFGVILFGMLLGIAALFAVIALCVRFIGVKKFKEKIEKEDVYKPVSLNFLNTGFIMGIIALSLSILAFVFSFFVFPFGIVSMSIGIVAGVMAIITMGFGFRSLKDDKGVKTKLTIIFAFIALLLISVGLVLAFI